MIEKVKAKLKTKYAKNGFNDAVILAIANFILPQVTEESEIDAAVESVSGLVGTFQSHADARANAAAAKAKEPKQEDPKTEEPNPTDPVSQQLASLTQIVTNLAATVTAVAKKDVVAEKKARIATALEGLTDIQKKPYLALKLEELEDADFETQFAEYSTDWDTIKAENGQTDLGKQTPPAGGGTAVDNKKKLKPLTEEEVDGFPLEI